MKRTYEIDTDDEYFREEEDYLRFLMMEDVVFCNNGWWDPNWPKDVISLHVNCNDTFAYACADAEDLRASELKELTEMYIKDERWGVTAWCVKKRKERPLREIVEGLEKAGYKLDELLAPPIDEKPEKPLDSKVDEKHLSPKT